MKINKYFNLTNSVLFWSFILILMTGMAFLNNFILDNKVQTNHTKNTIEQQSYQNTQSDEDIIDLENLNYTNINSKKRDQLLKYL